MNNRNGINTLKKIGKCERFNKHMYETIKPYLGEKIMEVGAGIGNITQFLLSSSKVTACDKDKNAIKILEGKFKNSENLSIIEWDIEKQKVYENWRNFFDSVVCLNVLEHIEDHKKALFNINSILNKDGTLVLLVPAYNTLYSNLDIALGHYRRYSKNELRKLLEKTGFSVLKLFYFNFLGLFGWLWTGKILGKRELPSHQIKIYDWLSRLFIPLEKIFSLPWGLSIIAIAKKTKKEND